MPLERDTFAPSLPRFPQLVVHRLASLRYTVARPTRRLLVVLFCIFFTLYHLHPTIPFTTKFHQESQLPRCSSDEFLLAIRDGKMKDGGDVPSAHRLQPSRKLELPPIDFSFDLADHNCEPMRAYGPKDACELLARFGGITAVGDAFMRHIWTTLLMLLRGRLDGSTHDFGRPNVDRTRCAGENAFEDQPAPGYCRYQIELDLQAREPICGGALVGRYIREDKPTNAAFQLVQSRMEHDVKGTKTPMLLQGFGLHSGLNVQSLAEWHDNLDEFSYAHPQKRVLSIWAGLHGGDDKQPEWVRELQGPEVVAAYDRALAEGLESVTPKVHNRMLDFFNVTLGAHHYDGVHLSTIDSPTASPSWVEVSLMLMAFSSSMVDTMTVPLLQVFVANNTGNLLLLGLGAAGLHSSYPELVVPDRAAVALVGSCVGNFVAGQLKHVFGPRRRIYLIAEFILEALLIFISAILLYSHAIAIDSPRTILAIIAILSYSYGAQSVMAKGLGGPTAMVQVVTGAMGELLADPKLFAPLGKNKLASAWLFLAVPGVKGVEEAESVEGDGGSQKQVV
ncbi:hypothetical protein MNV49_005850 [Pseudohyphozyma bogoriensis]|nr:hypothetical protein MNV49_005850 [Pseudohyphozyma bogoriensis]